MKTQELKAAVKIVIMCDMILLSKLYLFRATLIASTRECTVYVI
jgi:hypothetical protein